MSEFPEGNEPSNVITQYFKKRLLGDVQPDDEFIQVVGKVNSLGASQEFVLDDGTGTIQVREIPDDIDQIDPDMIYRVMGKFSIDPMGSAYLAAQIIQKLPGINLDFYIKTLELMKTIT